LSKKRIEKTGQKKKAMSFSWLLPNAILFPDQGGMISILSGWIWRFVKSG
jgi:hypothetical protein